MTTWSEDAISAQDINEFISYLEACTDNQVVGVYEKELAAGREAYVALALRELRARNILDF